MWNKVDIIIQRIESQIDFEYKQQIYRTHNIFLKKMKPVHFNLPALSEN